MLKQLLISILCIGAMTLAAQAQTTLPKQALPNEKNNSWKQNGWQGVDSGFINAVRDTSFRPRFAGTMVYWPHAGADTSLWLWTGQKWQRNTGNLSGGDTTIINNNISNYFDSTFNITNLGDTSIINNYIDSSITNYVDSIFNVTNLGDTNVVNNYLNNYIDSIFNITNLGDTTFINQYIDNSIINYIDSTFNINNIISDNSIINNYIDSSITQYVDSIFNVTNYGDTTNIINQYLSNYIDSTFNIFNAGDTTIINNYITYLIDSTVSANPIWGWNSAMKVNPDLMESYNSHLSTNELAFWSTATTGGVVTPPPADTTSTLFTHVGVKVAPQSNSFIVAPRLHVKLLRYGTTLTQDKTFPFQQAKPNGYDVLLTVNYKPFNGATDGSTDFVKAAGLNQFKTDFKTFIHNNKTFLNPAVPMALDNEENNLAYRPNANALDYINEAKAAIQVAHDSGYKITNGGLTGPYFLHWVWQALVANSRQADADTFARYMFTPAQLPNLGDWATIPQYQRGTALIDSLINSYDSLGFDYVNFHWYEPRQDTSRQSVDTTLMGWAITMLECATNKTIITNEIGQWNHSATIPVQYLRAANNRKMPFMVWYSGDDAGSGGGAVALQDTSTTLRSNGVAFAAFMTAAQVATGGGGSTSGQIGDTASAKTFAIKEQQVYLPVIKKNYRQYLLLDTSGRVYGDSSTVSGGGSIYFPPPSKFNITQRKDTLLVSASINQTVTGVVVNGAWLRLKGSGTPAANEAVINSATGLITFGQYVDAGDYVDVIYSPIGSSSGSSGGNYHLPYNGNSGYYLGGDSILHLLPAAGAGVAAGDTTTLNVHTNGYNDLRYGSLAQQNSNTTAIAGKLNIADTSFLHAQIVQDNSAISALATAVATNTTDLAAKLNSSTAAATYQPLENQRLSTTNTPAFAGLTANGIIKLTGLSNTPSAPLAGTQNMYADSTGAWTIQGSNGFALSISKSRLTANHRVYFQNKDYTVADSADVAANTIAIAGKLNIADSAALYTSLYKYNRNTEGFYGNIYKGSAFANTTGFTANGATVSASGGAIIFSGGNGFASQSLDYNYYTSLFHWKEYARVKILNASAIAGIGIRSSNPNRTINTYAAFDASSGVVKIYTDSTLAATSPALTFTVGDSIAFTMERQYDSLIAIASNYTTKSSEVRIAYLSQPNYPTNPQLHNTGKFAIYNLSSTAGNMFSVDSISIQSNEVVNALVACAGDSKTYGANGTSFRTSWAFQLAQNYFSTINVSGAGDRTSDFINRLPELIALHPRQAIVYIGINDVANGVSAAVWQPNIDTIYNRLTRNGIKVYLLNGIYDATANTATLKSWIEAHYPDSVIIHTFEQGAKIAGTVASDNFHPSDAGEIVVARTIINSYKLTNGTNLNEIMRASTAALPLTATAALPLTAGVSNPLTGTLYSSSASPNDFFNFRAGSTTTRIEGFYNGKQTWTLNTAAAGNGTEVGTLSISVPGSTPGFLFQNSSGTGRAQIRQYASAGGLAFGAGTGSGDPGTMLLLNTSGNVSIANTNDTYKLDVTGTVQAGQFKLSALNTAPTSATATGTTGEIKIANGFIYVCVATNTWQRAALATW